MHAHEQQIRRWFTAQQCSQCAAPYHQEKVVVLARRGEVWMVLASCAHCGRKGIFVVSFPGSSRKDRRNVLLEAEAFGEGALTEAVLADTPPATGDEPARLPVSDVDVIEMHFFLRQFNGNFAALFASPPGGSAL